MLQVEREPSVLVNSTLAPVMCLLLEALDPVLTTRALGRVRFRPSKGVTFSRSVAGQ